MDSVRVVHRPRLGISQEQARDARARAWDFVFDRLQQKQRAAEHVPPPKNCDDQKRLVCE